MIDDFDRPLNDRGKSDAKLIGEFMNRQKIAPDIALSSPARRARQTAEKVLKAAALEAQIEFDQGIYEAEARRLFEIVREIPDERNSVMLVGHNPGFEELLHLLTGGSISFPTAALARIELPTERWCDVRLRSGTLRSFVTPKNLKGEANN